MKTEYQTISARSKKLLNNSENLYVDFKKNANKINVEDFVAFANSDKGGVILFGVDETVDVRGRQKGIVFGCEPSDDNKLKIINKALSCVPQIDIIVVFENLSKTAFIRVEIPSGKMKPYCTQKGIYCIRENARNRALLPMDLLQMFLENESIEFFNRFNAVTNNLQEKIKELDVSIEKTTTQILDNFKKTTDELYSHVQGVSDNISDIEQRINGSLENIEVFSEEAVIMVDDTMESSNESLSTIYEVDQKLDSVVFDVQEIKDNSFAIIEKFQIESPYIKKVRKTMKELMTMFLALRPTARLKTIQNDIRKNFIISEEVFSQMSKEEFSILKESIKDPKSEISLLIKSRKNI